MAVVPPDDSINRIVSALGLENVRSLTISFAVNSAVAVVTEQYVTGNQMENLATALETKEWMLVPKDAGRWIPVSERLPEELTTVLVYSPDAPFAPSGIDLASQMDGDSWMLSDGRLAKPTHWMPLPEPPEVK